MKDIIKKIDEVACPDAQGLVLIECKSELTALRSKCAEQEKEIARIKKSDTNMIVSTAEVFAGFHHKEMEVHKLCRQLIQWKYCMSYNDSYFGEPVGLIKRIAYELGRILPATKDEK